MGYTSPRTYTIPVGFTSTTPLDSTTYYFGGHTASTMVTTDQQYYVIVPKSGHIRRAYVMTFSATAAGTAEDMVLQIRVNTTDYTFATVGLANAHRDFINNNLDIPVTAGDLIQFKIVTPAWVTNPDGIRGAGVLLIEAE